MHRSSHIVSSISIVRTITKVSGSSIPVPTKWTIARSTKGRAVFEFIVCKGAVALEISRPAGRSFRP